MLSLSRKTDYALLALAHLASQDAGAARLSARTLAERYDLPRSFVANLLKQLQQAGLIASSRGASGGYMLAQPPERITLAQVTRAMDQGAVELARCCRDAEQTACQSSQQEQRCACKLHEQCPIRESIQALDAQLQAIFETLTLKDLLERQVCQAIHRTFAQSDPAERPPGLTVLQ